MPRCKWDGQTAKMAARTSKGNKIQHCLERNGLPSNGIDTTIFQEIEMKLSSAEME